MDSPALTSRTFVRSITTAWSTLLPVIVAATSLMLLLAEVSSTWPPIILNGDTTATGLYPLLANADLPRVTVSKSTRARVALGEEPVACVEVLLIVL